MQNLNIEITGTTALLMHGDALADPLSDLTKDFKRVSSKRTKTDDDYEAMARMEFRAALYVGADGGVVIPAPNIVKCLIEGARITKSGAKVERGLVVAATDFPLTFDGPRDLGDLYRDKRFVSRMTVKVGTSRTVRCRPIFRSWGLVASVLVDTRVLGVEELGDIARNAGQMIGLGDYRRGGGFGRFDARVTPA